MGTKRVPSPKAMALLVSTLKGASGVETSRGTKTLWNELERAGYVSKMKHGGFFGHPFFYDLTEAGRSAIAAEKAKVTS